MHRTHSLAAFVLLISTPVTAQVEQEELDQKMLDAIVAEVRPAVAKATDTDLSGVRFRLVKAKEFATLVAEENSTFRAVELTKAQARLQGLRVSKLLLGKFKWSTNEVLLCPPNFKWQARSMDVPALLTKPAYRAVIVHECVHAADEERHGWSKVVTELKDPNRFTAYQAVIEGNAQRITARVCESQGWQKGFKIFTGHIGSIGTPKSAAQDLITRVVSANTRANYLEGRAFAELVSKAAGKKGIARAFADPPADFEAILNPGWFLDPKTRPAKLYDFTRPLKNFGKGFASDEWTVTTVNATTPQLRAGFSLLPKEQVDRVFDHLKQNSLIVFGDKARPGSRMVVAGLFEFDSPEGARVFMLADTALLRIKDEKMTTGRIRVVSSKSVDLSKFEMEGVLFDKIMKVGAQEIPVFTLVATKGSVAVELTYSNEVVTPSEAATLAKALLTDSATARQQPDSENHDTEKPDRKKTP